MFDYYAKHKKGVMTTSYRFGAVDKWGEVDKSEDIMEFPAGMPITILGELDVPSAAQGKMYIVASEPDRDVCSIHKSHIEIFEEEN